MPSVCLIINGLSTGGAEMMLCKLIQFADRERFQFQVISLTDRGELASRIESLGVPVTTLDMGRKSGFVRGFLRLVFLLRSMRPHIVHTWLYKADLIGGIAARLAGVRSVAWCVRQSNVSAAHNSASTMLTMRLCAALSRFIPDRILTCSRKALSNHVAVGYSSRKIDLIPNGFDFERFHPDPAARSSVRTELGLAPDAPLVGLIARHDPQKNHSGFIQAANLVRRRVPSANFVLAGGGVDSANESLVAQIRNAGLQDRVHLLGRRDDVPRLMASLDVIASASLGEAFPNVLGEAMACGVPCVVTDAGDSAEILGDAAWVVNVGDMEALADKLVCCLQLPASSRERIGAANRMRAEKLYEISEVARQFQTFYLTLQRNT